MIHPPVSITIARAEALFASDLATSSRPSLQEATTAIWRALRTYGGVRGCAAELAASYGECPETAAPRMRWARATVEALYQRPKRSAGPPRRDALSRCA